MYNNNMKLLSKEKYKRFQKASWIQLSNLNLEDIKLYDNKPLPLNYTIVLSLPQETTLEVSKIQSTIQKIDPGQLIIPQPNLHITLLGLIDIQTPISLLQKLIDDIELQTLVFYLYGMGSNEWSVSISAYPYFDLGILRSKFEQRLYKSADDYKVHLSEYHFMGWINILRYTHQPQLALLDFLRNEFKHDLGACKPQAIQLYQNRSRILSEAELIYERKL